MPFLAGVVIGFDPVEYTVGESDREVVLRVTKSGIAHRSVNVTFSTDDQTAFGNIGELCGREPLAISVSCVAESLWQYR